MCCRYCLGAGLAMVEMKVLLALVARHYTFTADNNTQWTQAIGKVPKVRHRPTFPAFADSCMMPGPVCACPTVCNGASAQVGMCLHRLRPACSSAHKLACEQCSQPLPFASFSQSCCSRWS
jgi:hypothetical protein